MRIALIGYGKMGKTLHRIAEENGDEVVYAIDHNNLALLDSVDSDSVDVAIEFSNPESAFDNIKHCLANGVPVISGTTGWLERYPEIELLCKERNGSFMYASNFSIGVNIFFELNKFLAKRMKNYRQYKVSIEEIHHTEKLDAPSGTAITLAEDIVEETPALNTWQEIHIESKRIGSTPGTHKITYNSEIDSIDLKHTAHGRKGFALGAYEAARWIVGKKGVFNIKDMLFNEADD